jgi:hypothetical protein
MIEHHPEPVGQRWVTVEHTMGKHLDRLNPRKIVRKELLNKSTLPHRQQIHELFQAISPPRRLALSKEFAGQVKEL